MSLLVRIANATDLKIMVSVHGRILWCDCYAILIRLVASAERSCAPMSVRNGCQPNIPLRYNDCKSGRPMKAFQSFLLIHLYFDRFIRICQISRFHHGRKAQKTSLSSTWIFYRVNTWLNTYIIGSILHLVIRLVAPKLIIQEINIKRNM